ncbi:MAG: DinB family protein [Phycisphaerales bacterium]
MNRDALRTMWDQSWAEVTWVAPWVKAIEGLTPEQAAWSPAPGRHSIWQIVNHVCFWREVTMTKLDPSRTSPRAEDAATLNFEPPAAITSGAWEQTRTRFKKSHDDLAAMLSRPDASTERPAGHLVHDAYHLGQIMYLRALQGLPKIE